MSNHFLVRRASRAAAAAAVLTPAVAHSLTATAEIPFAMPTERTVHEPIGKRHLLERMVIDTSSKEERVVLTVDMEKEDFVLYQVATEDGKVLRSGSWLLAPGSNELVLDAREWPFGTLELSVLTRKDLMKIPFERQS